jgi:hypothetical protein
MTRVVFGLLQTCTVTESYFQFVFRNTISPQKDKALNDSVIPKHYQMNAVFWDVARCGFIINRQTRRHILEDGIPHSHRRKNLKSYMN